MNKIIAEITDCNNCEYCRHNGMFQERPKYLCYYKQYSKVEVQEFKESGVKTNWGYPILRSALTYKELPIPDWCPRLKNSMQV